ncbi:hypothetical protein EDC04DRAFT_2208207 [Pisolithus marmoratus]|nr:hypothetical protein EDC04DRAFT_2208207 [Pisolithus marmoratus]
MLVPETLLRMLVRFPKLLITIARRCSSTTLYFLRYIFSLWNVSIQKLWERKHFTKGNLDNSPPSALPCKDREKDREVEASAGSATILCSRDRPADREALGGRTPQMRCCKPPLRQPMSSFDRLAGILSMVLGFDHPGFIGRSLGATQQSKAKRDRDLQRQTMQQDDPNRDHETDVKKWEKFGDTFQKDVENINLLATVLLTANFSFLAI